MNASHAFISHAHADSAFANLLTETLRAADLSAWIDKDNILVGDTILDGVGTGLKTTDLLIFIISRASLQSEWCRREVNFVAQREITEKRVLIVPVIIDDVLNSDLPWHLQGRHTLRVPPNADGAQAAALSVRQVLQERFGRYEKGLAEGGSPTRDPVIDKLIENVELGDWRAAEIAAIEVLKLTEANGRNTHFEKLLRYCGSQDQKLIWRALPTIESCVSLAPWLINYEVLRTMGTHKNISVRSSAASICMDLANFAPDRVPIDILIKLSVYDEDWYVQAPANAALKTLVGSMPGVLRIFYTRIDSSDTDESAHAAAALRDIAATEPELLELAELKRYLKRVNATKNREAKQYLEAAIDSLERAQLPRRYKYGL
jgi:hypothetical protein